MNVRFYPDLIIHNRGAGKNLCVFEFKVCNSRSLIEHTAFDLLKLHYMKTIFAYNEAFFILLCFQDLRKVEIIRIFKNSDFDQILERLDNHDCGD